MTLRFVQSATTLSTAVFTSLATATPTYTDPNMAPVDYSLLVIREACEPFIEQARYSQADSDAARFCLVEGEAIALSSSRTPQDVQKARAKIASWISEVKRESSRYQRSLALN